MPLYYFDIEDGVSIPDTVGMQFRGLVEARGEAVRRSTAVLSDISAHPWAGEPWLIKIKNDWGLTLFSLHFAGEAGDEPLQMDSQTALERASTRYRARAEEMAALALQGSTEAIRSQHRELHKLWLELAEAMEAQKPHVAETAAIQ